MKDKQEWKPDDGKGWERGMLTRKRKPDKESQGNRAKRCKLNWGEMWKSLILIKTQETGGEGKEGGDCQKCNNPSLIGESDYLH